MRQISKKSCYKNNYYEKEMCYQHEIAIDYMILYFGNSQMSKLFSLSDPAIFFLDFNPSQTMV